MSNDHTTDMIIEMLEQHLTTEPPQDMGMHPSVDLQAEMGNVWAEWSKEKRALERILAPRLIRSALRSTK